MRLTLLLGIIATTCHAGNCTDGRPGTTVFFLNGILGDPMETERAKDALKTRVVQALQGTPKQNACLVFLNAYNLSGGFFADVLESYRQQVGDAAASQTFLDVVDGSTPPSLLQISYTSATLRSLVIPSTAQPVVDAHVVFFEQVLSESNQVIVVAHSQGNFFANEEYARLLQRGTLVPERFKIISVATPDSFTAGNGPYSTLCSDFIVKFILGARPANICSSALQSAVLWQHGFEKWYLGNVLSRTQIINQIVDAIQVPVAGTGIVTVNATLDGSPWSDAGNSSFGSYIQSTVSCGSPGATKAQISNNLVPTTTRNMTSGSCNLVYVSGAPPNSTLSGITPCVGSLSAAPSCSSPLVGGQFLTFTFRFTTNPSPSPPTAGFLMSSGGQSKTDGQTLNPPVLGGNAADVSFDATGRSLAFNGATITNWTWTANGSIIGTTSNFSATFPVGTHNILLVVKDSRNNSSVAALGTITVTEVPTVQSTGSLKTARYAHTATLLNNGMVLVTGGNAQSSAGLNTAELYDPQTGTWRYTGIGQQTLMVQARTGHTATKLLNGKVLIASGSDGPGRVISAELFDPATETFTATGSLIDGRNSHAAVLLNDGTGRVIVVGGYQRDGQDYGSAEIYDPATGKWTMSNNTLQYRAEVAIALLPNGNVLVAGGGISKRVDQFNPTTNTWQSLTQLIVPRWVHSATALPNNKVLVAGGNDGNSAYFTAELYDPSANNGLGQSTLVPGTLTVGGWENAGIGLLSGNVFLAGGHNFSGGTATTTANTQIYNFASNSLSSPGSMIVPRSVFPMVRLLTNQILIPGGLGLLSSVGTPLSNTEIWTFQ